MKFCCEMEYRGKEDGKFPDNGKQYSILKLEEIDTGSQRQFYAMWENIYSVGLKNLERGKVYLCHFDASRYEGSWRIKITDIEDRPFNDAA